MSRAADSTERNVLLGGGVVGVGLGGLLDVLVFYLVFQCYSTLRTFPRH